MQEARQRLHKQVQTEFYEKIQHPISALPLVRSRPRPPPPSIGKAWKTMLAHSFGQAVWQLCPGHGGWPKPMENATLSFLSEYSKRALQQAEKALFSPQDFNDVVQQSTSEDDDDEEGLI